MEGERDNKGRVCVTGGTGYVASWLIMKLLQLGYSVNTTARFLPSPDNKKKELSFLTNLPGASQRLQIFNADLDKPESFIAAIEGCIGVFHVAHPIDFEDKETEEMKTKRAINGTLGILKACIDSKTVRRVVYTSSGSAIQFDNNGLDIVDESAWSDVDFIRDLKRWGASYCITKTLTEKAALDFAEKNGLDLVTVIPTFIHGPFILPHCPSSVVASMALIFGERDKYSIFTRTCFVHIDDVADAHIFLFEHPDAKGRYICSAVETTMDKMVEFLSTRYPQYQIPTLESLKEFEGAKSPGVSSRKLLGTGFKYKYGLEEMFDGAIQCCTERGYQ